MLARSIPAKVQGPGATEDIVRGIGIAAKLQPKLDLLVVGRGGGSLEDLWCFNEEKVVRALAACPIPTISAVGHEVDVTLSDLVADARALTPTHAAEVGLPSASELAGYLAQAQMRMTTTLHTRIRHLQQRLEQLSHARAIARPQELIHMRRQMLDEWDGRARMAMWQLLRQHRQRVEGLARAAHALSPLQVLGRGYSLTSRSDGQLIRDADEVVNGDKITTVLERGAIVSQVIKKA